MIVESSWPASEDKTAAAAAAEIEEGGKMCLEFICKYQVTSSQAWLSSFFFLSFAS